MSAAVGDDVFSCGEEPGMTRIGRVAAVLAAVVVAQGSEFEREVAARAKPRTLALSVTMADGPGDRIRGNLGLTYTHGVGGVVAFENGSGLQLQTGSRGLSYDFSDCLWTVPDQCTPLFDAGIEPSLVQIYPVQGGVVSGGLLGIPVGTQLRAFAKFYFSANTSNGFWTVCSDPRPVAAAGICGASPASAGVLVARTGSGTWVVSASPSSSSGRSDVADLISEVGNGRRTTITVEGTFSMPFTMTIQCVVAADCPVPN
jgi:hypothetical protein